MELRNGVEKFHIDYIILNGKIIGIDTERMRHNGYRKF